MVSKTPEQMAREYAITRELFDPHRITFDSRLWLEQGFLAGYQAAKDQLADADKVMCNATMKEIEAVDAGELMPITNLLTSAQWISVKERLPDAGVRVLVNAERYPSIGFMRKGSWCWISDKGFILSFAREITHWMPLPAPPKETPDANA